MTRNRRADMYYWSATRHTQWASMQTRAAWHHYGRITRSDAGGPVSPYRVGSVGDEYEQPWRVPLCDAGAGERTRRELALALRCLERADALAGRAPHHVT